MEVISEVAAITIPVALHEEIEAFQGKGTQSPEGVTSSQAMALCLGLGCMRLARDPDNTLVHVTGQIPKVKGELSRRKTYRILPQVWAWITNARDLHQHRKEEKPLNVGKIAGLGLQDLWNLWGQGHACDQLWEWCQKELGNPPIVSTQPVRRGSKNVPTPQVITYTWQVGGAYSQTQNYEEAVLALQAGYVVQWWDAGGQVWKMWA